VSKGNCYYDDVPCINFLTLLLVAEPGLSTQPPGPGEWILSLPCLLFLFCRYL